MPLGNQSEPIMRPRASNRSNRIPYRSFLTEEYDPDRARPLFTSVIVLVLAAFALAA